jgi:predicted nucleic-acid-binding Zn-ribbon protein
MKLTAVAEAEFNRKRIVHLCRKEAEKKDCPRCGKNNWAIVPLYEYGDPYMPSRVDKMCKNCKFSETMAQASEEEARKFGEEYMKSIGKNKAADDFKNKFLKK